jgi:hypothetical protein
MNHEAPVKTPQHTLTKVLVACVMGLALVACYAPPSPSGVVPEPSAMNAPPADADDIAEDDSPTEPPLTTVLELRDGMRRLWRDHVTWTRIFIVADIVAFDSVVGHALSIADTLSDGITKQFPDKL